jgi:hypothetical protein
MRGIGMRRYATNVQPELSGLMWAGDEPMKERGSPALHAARTGMRVPVRNCVGVREPRPVRGPHRARRLGSGRLRRHQCDTQCGQPRSGAQRGDLPREPRTRTRRRERAGRQRAAAEGRAAPQRGHGGERLLRSRRPGRGHAAGSHARRGLRLERQGVRSGREHRLGHPGPVDAARDRRGVDGLAGAPREHSRPPLQRHGDRRRHARAGLVRARAARRAVYAGFRGDPHRQGCAIPRPTHASI